ncbi:MAG: YggS family pyridoxal phosphate-dependent enzyme [Pirellulales bacterium]
MTRPASAETESIIRENWLRVRNQVAEACIAASRDPSEVKIIGVAKYVDAALTSQLVASGCDTIGENRPQLLWEKHQWFSDQGLTQPRWHMIGHMQRNKLRRTLPLLSMLESVDNWRLAEELSAEAVRAQHSIDFLVDVNLTQDNTKTGMMSDELLRVCEQLVELPNLNWRGLMAMSSLEADSATISREFSAVRELRDQLQVRLGNRVDLSELSMGMSGDYQQAIQQGSTCVRIGTSLWAGVI